MLNNTGTTRETFGNRNQILADVGNQSSIGCVVSATIGVDVGSRKIAKAGTPIRMDLMNPNAPANLATASVAMRTVQRTDPVQVETIVSQICLPSLERADSIYILNTGA